MEILSKLFYHLGSYGPTILIFISLILLWNKSNLFNYYLIGVFLNVIINIVLKGIIQQARPSDDPKLLKIALKDGSRTIFKHGVPFNIFGMPSGHAESSFYTTVFIWFSLKNNYIFSAYLLFSLLIISQRVYLEYHTVFQVFVGAIVGSTFAYLIYYLSQKKIVGKLLPRKEDNGPKDN